MNVNLLHRLAKHGCGDLVAAAEKALAGKKRVLIPLVPDPVLIRFVPKHNKKCKGFFRPDRITVYTRGVGRPWRKRIIATLVHEMRHAQQMQILGRRTFYKHVEPGLQMCTALEVDANAAEIALRCESPFKGLCQICGRPDIRRIIRGIEKICRTHARYMGRIK